MFGFSHSNFYLGFINKCSHEFVKEVSNESYLFYEVANINSKHMPFKIRNTQLSIKIKKSINCIKKFNLNECTQIPIKRTLLQSSTIYSIMCSLWWSERTRFMSRWRYFPICGVVSTLKSKSAQKSGKLILIPSWVKTKHV